jgi:hypothetical protein
MTRMVRGRVQDYAVSQVTWRHRMGMIRRALKPPPRRELRCKDFEQSF